MPQASQKVPKVWAAGMMNFPLFQHAMTFRVYPNQPALATLQSTLDMMKSQ